MEEKDTYNDIVQYYRDKNTNKKETIAADNPANPVSFEKNVVVSEKPEIKESAPETKKETDNKTKQEPKSNQNNTEKFTADEIDLKNEPEKESEEVKETETKKAKKEKQQKEKSEPKKEKKEKSKKKSKKTESDNSQENGEQETERKKKISLKRLALNIFTICIIGMVCGYLIGTQIISKVYMNINYDKFQEDILRDSDSDIEKWSNMKIEELTPTQVYAVAEKKLDSRPYYTIAGTGTIKNSFKNQDVIVKFYKNGNEFFCQNLSTGFVNTTTAYFYDGEKVIGYKGTPKENGEENWKSKKEYTKEEFKAVYGNDVTKFLYYIVSTKTAVSEELVSKTGNQYKFHIKLTDDSSIANYVKQMEYMSGIASPVFNCVEFEFVVDSDFNLVSLVTHDIYVVNYVALVTCEGSSSVRYYYDEPEIETQPEVE